MDSLIYFISAIVTLLIGGGISISLTFKTSSVAIILIPIGIAVAIALPFTYISNVDQINENKAKDLAEKTKIDLLSCRELGNYVINNANNSTDSDGQVLNDEYKYAEAKYLVCTHTPSSEMSP